MARFVVLNRNSTGEAVALNPDYIASIVPAPGAPETVSVLQVKCGLQGEQFTIRGNVAEVLAKIAKAKP